MGNILERYDQEHSEKIPARVIEAPAEGRLIQWVFRYSGGRIHDAKQAVFVLLGMCAFLILIAVYFFIGSVAGNTIDTSKGIIRATPGINR